eukprot:5744845-Amphidinium_carterae.1
MARAIEQRNKNSETALAAEACTLRTALLQTLDAARALQGKTHFLENLAIGEQKKVSEYKEERSRDRAEAFQPEINRQEETFRRGKEGPEEKHIDAWDNRDFYKMKEVCYSYFDMQREIQCKWTKMQIEKDLKKNDRGYAEQSKAARRRTSTSREGKARRRSTIRSSKSKGKTFSSTRSTSSNSSDIFYRTTKTYEASTYRTTRSRSLKGKGKGQQKRGEIPATPSKPILSPRLRLEKKNFYTGLVQNPTPTTRSRYYRR